MTLRTWRRLFIIGVVVVVLQVGLLDGIVVGGAHPDAWLLMAICAGLVGGPRYGAVVGFVTGLVADLFVVTPFGLTSLCLVLVAFSVGQLASLSGGRAPHLSRVAVAFVASIGGTLLYEGLAILVGLPHLPRHELADVVLVVAVGNAVLAVPAVAVMRWVFSSAAAEGRELVGAGAGR